MKFRVKNSPRSLPKKTVKRADKLDSKFEIKRVVKTRQSPPQKPQVRVWNKPEGLGNSKK